MFYETLKDVCKQKQTSPSAVVTALGMSKSNITKWKHGISPRLDVVIRIANHLGVDVACLVRDEKGA